ncbi:MAG TPA: hypothetical protein PK228_09105, partial [Saprospiraceae bacterium]|nr:hypothetical protein [Saprospiraceae bacterium]
MISQAYIFGALGKAAFQQGDKWYVLDADDPNTVRAWHSFDNNWLSLSDPEIVSVPQGKNLDEIRQLLALETSKQEALTLALQLMDESIREESLKAEIAELLEEYAQDTTVFHFLENRLLTTVVPDSFDPSFASNICRSLRLKKITGVYEMLDTHARQIQIFYTAWLNVAKDYFNDIETADAAFSLLTSEGIAKTFVQSIANGDKHLWDNAAVNAALLLKKEKIDSNALRFFTSLKADLTRYFDVKFQEETHRAEQEKEETDEIADLIEEYLENRLEQKQATKKIWKPGAAKKAKAKKSTYELLGAAQANVEYFSQKILSSLREGNKAGARASLKELLKQQIQTSAPEHICKSLTNIAGFLLSNGVIDFTKTLMGYAKALNGNDLVVDTLGAEVLKAEGKLAEAREEYLRIKQQFPDNIFAQTGYAEILKAEGKLAEA